MTHLSKDGTRTLQKAKTDLRNSSVMTKGLLWAFKHSVIDHWLVRSAVKARPDMIDTKQEVTKCPDSL